MVTGGLRERKKARTRQLIADTAARLFAERGYEQVAVSEVAREAEVAEQTLYNYFPTKEHLVTDREDQTQAQIAHELYPIVKSVLDELDRWLSSSGPSRVLPPTDRKRSRTKD